MNRTILTALCAGLLGVFSPGAARAQVIVQYSFAGTPASLAPTTATANVIANNVNFTGSTDSQNPAIPNFLVINTPISAISAATAVANNSYYQFTVTPTTGFTMNFSSLTFSAADGFPGSGYDLRSSVDGFSSDVASGVIPTVFPSLTPVSVSLAGAQFQGLSTAETFRIYSFTGNPANGSAAIAYQNLTLSGAVASTPEPSAFAMSALLGLGGGGWWWRQRRRSAVTAPAA